MSNSNKKKINSILVVVFLLAFLFGTFVFVGKEIVAEKQHTNIYIKPTNDLKLKEDKKIEVQTNSTFGLTSSKTISIISLTNEEYNQMKHDGQMQRLYLATIILVSFFILCIFIIFVSNREGGLYE